MTGEERKTRRVGAGGAADRRTGGGAGGAMGAVVYVPLLHRPQNKTDPDSSCPLPDLLWTPPPRLPFYLRLAGEGVGQGRRRRRRQPGRQERRRVGHAGPAARDRLDGARRAADGGRLLRRDRRVGGRGGATRAHDGAGGEGPRDEGEGVWGGRWRETRRECCDKLQVHYGVPVCCASVLQRLERPLLAAPRVHTHNPRPSRTRRRSSRRCRKRSPKSPRRRRRRWTARRRPLQRRRQRLRRQRRRPRRPRPAATARQCRRRRRRPWPQQRRRWLAPPQPLRLLLQQRRRRRRRRRRTTATPRRAPRRPTRRRRSRRARSRAPCSRTLTEERGSARSRRLCMKNPWTQNRTPQHNTIPSLPCPALSDP